ncbi:MAG TPA: tetratricopeptide repeat protein [Edaphobacter sp.]
MTASNRKTSLQLRSPKVMLALLGVLLLLGVAAWYATRPKTQKASTDSSENNGYVDPQVCAGCHAGIAETYKKTGMGRSFYKPSAQNVIEDFAKANTFVHKLSGLRYTMTQRDGKFYERRFTLDENGKETNVLEEQIDYVVGSGNQARTYLHRTSQGKLVELPVSWYSEKSGYWNMSPGFDRNDQPDMHGAIGPECLFCHNAYPNIEDTGMTEQSIFPEKMPEGIDCQRCHGPGAAHVKAVTSGKASLEEIRSKIVNPAKLPRDRQMEVCMECHLETSAAHIPAAVIAYGRDIYSFRPGQPLGDYKTYFERPKDPKADEFEVAHAGYQLRRSACFRNSQMTCLTCHNPHDIPRGEPAKKQYIAVCEGCHKGVSHKNVAMTAGSDCLSCHMPKRRTEGSVHTILTDHYIQRFRPLRDLLAPIQEPKLPENLTPVEIYYPKPAPANAMTELAFAVARVRDEGIDGIGQLQGVLARQQPKWAEPYVALGKAYVQKGRLDDAVRSFETALQKKPDDRVALRELAAALMRQGQVDRAIERLQRVTTLYPKDDESFANLGNAYMQQGKLQEAKDALSHALALNPERAEAQNLAGLCDVQSGDKAGAEQAFLEAIRLQPNLPDPQNNLANLMTGEQRFHDAEAHFKRAIELNPEYGDAHHGLGLLLILEHNYGVAEKELQTAARTSPNNVTVHTDLADLLSAQGRLGDAASEYRRALEVNHASPDANFGLGMLLLQQGQGGEALPYLQQAAQGSNPEISQHAQGILQQMMR